MTRAVTLAEIADGNTFIVDSTNNRVGIASTIPTTTLDVGGAVKATSFTGNITGNATGLTGTPDIAVRNITGVAATFTGVLTYEDVTNIDSVGIITARSDVSIADKIIHTGDTNTAIRFPAADTFTVETAGSERLRIDSSGNVGINVTPPSFGSFKYFSVKGNSTSQGGIVHVVNSDDSVSGQFFSYNNLIWLQSSTNHPLVFGINGSNEKARIDSSGRLLIGRTTSQNDNIGGIGYANLVQIEGAATGSGLAVSNTGGTARININREYTPVNGDDLGYLSFGAETTSVERARITCAAEFTNANKRGGILKFATCADSAHDPTERLRITSAGRFGFNTNSPDYTVDINGEVGITEGQPITWHDGSGNPSAQIFAQSDDSLVFRNTSAGAERMRMLPGGGLAFNGDTAQANALDDYEEGTWTPTPQFGGNSVSMTGSFSGRYTKIGNLVTVSYALTFTAKGSSTGDFRIPNLPYSNAITGLNDSGFSYLHRLNAAQTKGQLYVNVGGTIATFRWPGYVGSNTTIVQNGDLVDSTAISGFVSYQV